MTDDVATLHSHKNSGVIIDSNLLLLLFLAGYDRRQISTNSRLADFTEDDYDLLVQMLKPVRRPVTTPNILTEVSNLSNAVPERQGRHISRISQAG